MNNVYILSAVRTAIGKAGRGTLAATRPDTFQQFSAKYHTTTAQLADLAREARPRLLILYHFASRSPEELVAEMVAGYPGHFVIGRDLDVY